MPNKNYIAGRTLEYQVMDSYRKRGWLVFRSAGSHGPADVIAVEPKEKVIHFIQCKRFKSKADNEFVKLPIPHVLSALKVWVTKEKRKKMKWELV